MSVILKKDEKVKIVIEALSANYSVQDFANKFKELFPNDWKKVELAYQKHIRDKNPGKSVPMPNPEQYLKNSLNVYLKKNT